MKNELWEKIAGFDLEHPMSEYGFSLRLANENAWTKNFTQKAILEYKKFMYLAATNDYMVSPSEIVDVVWHQHLIFTQSYGEFCILLGKNIRHIPSTHSRADAERFKQAKERTKILYSGVFGEQPATFWNYENMFEPLALPKAKFKIHTIIVVGIVAFIFLSLPMYQLLMPVYIHLNNPGFLYKYLFIFLCVLLSLELFNRSYLKRVTDGWKRYTFIYDLTPLELVYLKKGNLSHVIHGVTGKFMQENKLVINYDNTLTLIYYGIAEDAENYAVLEYLGNNKRSTYSSLLWRMQQMPVFANIANCMNAFKKYFVKSKAFGKLFSINFVILLTVLMLSIVRLLTGITRDKPIVFISITIIASVIIITMFLWRLTRMIFTTTIPQLYKTDIMPAMENAADWDWQYFLSGTSILSASLLPLINPLQNINSTGGDGGGGGCGGGCGGGGGGCGGGCGGCGGG